MLNHLIRKHEYARMRLDEVISLCRYREVPREEVERMLKDGESGMVVRVGPNHQTDSHGMLGDKHRRDDSSDEGSNIIVSTRKRKLRLSKARRVVTNSGGEDEVDYQPHQVKIKEENVEEAKNGEAEKEKSEGEGGDGRRQSKRLARANWGGFDSEEETFPNISR
jgi:hypothetical protein